MSASANQFGQLFQWSTFGESHGAAMGVVIDGCPAGVTFDAVLLETKLKARRPGQNEQVSARQEPDRPKVLSGVFEGKTLGTPIAVIIPNQDARSEDYKDVRSNPRVGHADDSWVGKFGHSDFRGGGRASARETVNWVIAGSFAQMFVHGQVPGVQIQTRLTSVGPLKENELATKLNDLLAEAKESGDSYGAQMQITLENVPPFLGEPIFHKIKADLAHAFMSLNAVTGVELGGGFSMTQKKGSEVHLTQNSEVYGGIRGGITTGEWIHMNLAFKPTATIGELSKKGRHDPCVAIRAGVVVEAMAWSVLADHLLMARLNRL